MAGKCWLGHKAAILRDKKARAKAGSGRATALLVPGRAILLAVVIAIGIVGIYLSRVFIETKQRPYTIVSHVYERSE